MDNIHLWGTEEEVIGWNKRGKGLRSWVTSLVLRESTRRKEWERGVSSEGLDDSLEVESCYLLFDTPCFRLSPVAHHAAPVKSLQALFAAVMKLSVHKSHSSLQEAALDRSVGKTGGCLLCVCFEPPLHIEVKKLD